MGGLVKFNKMKKLVLILFISFSLVSSAQQFPNVNNGKANLVQDPDWYITDSSFIKNSYKDTLQANKHPAIKTYPGILILTGNQIWIRNNKANAWIALNTGSTTTGSSGYREMIKVTKDGTLIINKN